MTYFNNLTPFLIISQLDPHLYLLPGLHNPLSIILPFNHRIKTEEDDTKHYSDHQTPKNKHWEFIVIIKRSTGVSEVIGIADTLGGQLVTEPVKAGGAVDLDGCNRYHYWFFGHRI